jgi:8-oxo-dGTP pyrophosphatase MutT (NUDIX family)
LPSKWQYGALPFRLDPEFKILLVTSRGTQRWVIPKGWPIKGLTPHASAAREAFEEAGVVGEADRKALGTYIYGKRMKNGAILQCEVEVFPLPVARHHGKWPEQHQRVARWFAPDEAASAVQEKELAELIRNFAARY